MQARMKSPGIVNRVKVATRQVPGERAHQGPA